MVVCLMLILGREYTKLIITALADSRGFLFRAVEESGRPLLPWKQEIAGSNPARSTNGR